LSDKSCVELPLTLDLDEALARLQEAVTGEMQVRGDAVGKIQGLIAAASGRRYWSGKGGVSIHKFRAAYSTTM
jgi:hypothetical protein